MEGEREREGEKDQHAVVPHMAQACNPGTCPDWESS